MTSAIGTGGGLFIGSDRTDLSGPTLGLAPADSADVSAANTGKIRYNSTSALLELSVNAGPWTAFASTVTGAPSNARFIIQVPNGSLPNAQSLSALATGLLRNTTGTGVLTTAIANTDFPALNASYLVSTSTNAPPNAQNLGALSSGILKQTVTTGTATVSIALPDIDYAVPNNVRVANLTQLAGINITNLSNLTWRWVATLRSWFFLDKISTLTADSITIVTASGGTGRWLRTDVADNFWASIPFWAISWATGNDEAPGGGSSQSAADGVPLKTLAELNRRLSKNGITLPEVIIHILDSLPESEITEAIITNIKLQNADTLVRVIGKKTPVVIGGGFTGVITGYTAASPATNGEIAITIATLPAANSWTALVGKMIQNVAGTKTSFILRDAGSRTARIGQPDSADPLGANSTAMVGAPVNFTIGETVVIYDLPEMPAYPISGSAGDYQDNLVLGDIRLHRTTEGADMILDSSAPNIIHCRLTDPVIKGGLSTSKFIGCLFDGDTITVGFWAAAKGVTLYYSKFIRTCLLLDNSSLSCAISCDIEGDDGVFAIFAMQDHFNHVQTNGCAFGIFRLNVPLIVGNHGSIFTNLGSVSPIYGSGNTVAILAQPSGTVWKIYRSGFTATTSALHQVIIAGIGYNISQMSPHIVDLSTGTALLDTT